MGWLRHAVAAALLTLALTPESRAACTGDPQPDGIVRAVPEPLVLALADGRTVRLAGLEPPRDPAPAQKFLERTLAGARVRLATVGPPVDRYGRLAAYVFPADAPHFVKPRSELLGLEGSVQQAMLSQGLARVAARAGSVGCAARLWQSERQARLAEASLWADPANAVRNADDPASVLDLRGLMAVVEGRVRSVRESGATVYVNFGRRWSEDFTVTVPRRDLRRLAAAGLDVKALARRQVRIRGWVEERGGPWIELGHAEQVELIGD